MSARNAHPPSSRLPRNPVACPEEELTDLGNVGCQECPSDLMPFPTHPGAGHILQRHPAPTLSTSEYAGVPCGQPRSPRSSSHISIASSLPNVDLQSVICLQGRIYHHGLRVVAPG